MAKAKSEQMDFKGLEVHADTFVGDVVGDITGTISAGNTSVDAPSSDATWTNVQTALEDIASRLAVLETT